MTLARGEPARQGLEWAGRNPGDSGDTRLAGRQAACVDAVGYVLIAMVWANHHRLMRYGTTATAPLMWANLAHLFSVA